MRVDDFDFDLPEALIALRPARPREAGRLLVVPPEGALADAHVRDLPSLLREGDLIVANDTRVIPARLLGQRVRGENTVRVEANLHRRLDASRWSAFMRPGKRLAPDDIVRFSPPHDRACELGALEARIESKGKGGEVTLAFALSGPVLDEAIALNGSAPLPPYILSKRESDDDDITDYQTAFARADGAVAAPTAGLHVTPDLMAALKARGVDLTFVTLHVGAGTFLPVKADDTKDHVMHAEWREISPAVAEAINAAKAAGRRVIALGTTALRTLESSAEGGQVRAGAGDTSIFITPGHRFAIADGLITNFHLPRSTLFMLVSAFCGVEQMRAAYAHAIAQRYRFYSYGDASLLWRAQ